MQRGNPLADNMAMPMNVQSRSQPANCHEMRSVWNAHEIAFDDCGMGDVFLGPPHVDGQPVEYNYNAGIASSICCEPSATNKNREKNRKAQERFRLRRKVEAETLRNKLASRRVQLEQAQARLAFAESNGMQLLNRVSCVLQQLCSRAPSLVLGPQAALPKPPARSSDAQPPAHAQSCPPAADRPVFCGNGSLIFATASPVKSDSRGSELHATLDPGQLLRALSPDDAIAACTHFKTFSTALRASVAERHQRRSTDICWHIRAPFDVQGVPLLITSHLGTPECMVGTLVYGVLNFLEFQSLLAQLAELETLAGAVGASVLRAQNTSAARADSADWLWEHARQTATQLCLTAQPPQRLSLLAALPVLLLQRVRHHASNLTLAQLSKVCARISCVIDHLSPEGPAASPQQATSAHKDDGPIAQFWQLNASVMHATRQMLQQVRDELNTKPERWQTREPWSPMPLAELRAMHQAIEADMKLLSEQWDATITMLFIDAPKAVRVLGMSAVSPTRLGFRTFEEINIRVYGVLDLSEVQKRSLAFVYTSYKEEKARLSDARTTLLDHIALLPASVDLPGVPVAFARQPADSWRTRPPVSAATAARPRDAAAPVPPQSPHPRDWPQRLLGADVDALVRAEGVLSGLKLLQERETEVFVDVLLTLLHSVLNVRQRVALLTEFFPYMCDGFRICQLAFNEMQQADIIMPFSSLYAV